MSQAQKKLQQLFRQATREYAAWITSEEDAGKVISSLVHILERLDLMTGPSSASNLGVLASFADLPQALIECHMTELERLMRLLRQLYGQMMDQFGRLERLGGECLTLFRDHIAEDIGYSTGDYAHKDNHSQDVERTSGLCSVVTSLGHEMWRKGSLIETLNYGTEAADLEMRQKALQQWSSKSGATALNRTFADDLLTGND